VAAVTGLKKGDGPGGAIGTRVKKLQAALMKQGFSVGSKGDDGDFGTNTKTALKAFMASINVAGDGSIVTAPVAQALADKGNGTYSRQGTAVDEAWYNRFFQQALPSGGEIQGAGTTFVSSWMNFMKGNVTPVPTTTPTSTYVPPAAPRVPWGMIVGTVFVSFGLIYLARSRRQRQQF
jgi:peptidoglycan hydrolase-like protein with peptidoglycan-binding domain